MRFALALAAVSLATACSDPSPIVFPPLPTTCAVPEPPPPLPTSAVVGTGSAASCTEAALRVAIAEGGNVSFDCGAAPVTIAVASEIVVAHDTILDGAGLVTLDGGGVSRVLHTEARVALTVRRVAFAHGLATATLGGLASGGAIRVGWLGTLGVFDCTFTDNAAAADGIEGGGAIYQSNGGALVVVRSTFTGNSAVGGGAIDNLLSPMTLVDSTFTQNQSLTGGGAIYDDGASASIDDDVGGTISICGCRFEENQTLGTGGAVYLWAYAPDRLIINRSTFVRNVARRPAGGSALGGALRTGNAPLQLGNSLFAENQADVHGGAYWTDGEYRARISDCTFVRNQAGVAGEEGGYGGALSGFNMELINLTFVDNHAEFTGGAISNEGGEFTLRNSIFVGNTASNPWGTSQTCASTMSGAHNLQWPAPASSGDPPCTADVVLADPLLGELADNGGPTQTIAPGEGSPALGAGEDCTEADQRGEPRGEVCDLGAFEAP
jgi:hypothetical protein